jgi:hypothetical protein
MPSSREQKPTIFARAIRRVRWDVWLSKMETRLELMLISLRWKNIGRWQEKSADAQTTQSIRKDGAGGIAADSGKSVRDSEYWLSIP